DCILRFDLCAELLGQGRLELRLLAIVGLLSIALLSREGLLVLADAPRIGGFSGRTLFGVGRVQRGLLLGIGGLGLRQLPLFGLLGLRQLIRRGLLRLSIGGVIFALPLGQIPVDRRDQIGALSLSTGSGVRFPLGLCRALIRDLLLEVRHLLGRFLFGLGILARLLRLQGGQLRSVLGLELRLRSRGCGGRFGLLLLIRLLLLRLLRGDAGLFLGQAGRGLLFRPRSLALGLLYLALLIALGDR